MGVYHAVNQLRCEKTPQDIVHNYVYIYITDYNCNILQRYLTVRICWDGKKPRHPESFMNCYELFIQQILWWRWRWHAQFPWWNPLSLDSFGSHLVCWTLQNATAQDLQNFEQDVVTQELGPAARRYGFQIWYVFVRWFCWNTCQNSPKSCLGHYVSHVTIYGVPNGSVYTSSILLLCTHTQSSIHS